MAWYSFLLINNFIPTNFLGAIDNGLFLYISQFSFFLIVSSYYFFNTSFYINRNFLLLFLTFFVFLFLIYFVNIFHFDLFMKKIRVFLSFLIIYFSFSTFSYSNISDKSKVRFIDIVIYSNILFSYYHIFVDFDFITSLYNPMYSNTWLGLQTGGMYIWSYSFGYTMLSLVFLRFLISKDVNLPLSLLLFPLILLTQSKSVYLIVLFALLFVFVFASFKVRALISLFFFFLTITGFNYIEDFGNVYRFIDAISSSRIDGSTYTRLIQIEAVLNELSNNFFGTVDTDILIEVGFFHYLYMIGPIFLLFISFFFIFFKFINRFMIFYLLFFLIGNFSFVPLESPKAWVINCVLFGLILFECKRYKSQENLLDLT